MSTNDDRWKAMAFEGPDFIPVSVGFLPATWMKYRDDLDALVARHPVLFGGDQPEDRDYDAIWSPTYGEGRHVDFWGCVWENVAHGAEAIVTKHPVPTREDVRNLEMPAPGGGMPHGFMWLRLADLRGFEELMIDFAEEPPELQMLIDTVLGYNVGELAPRLENPQSVMYFGDDLGMQDRLAISHEKWVKYLKPCYAKLYGMARDAGSKVYMHTDGHTIPVIMDLVECGVNVINLQIRANGLQRTAEICKGKVCVDLDLDRQLFPFCSPDDIDGHIREAVETLGSPEGGLYLSASCGPDVPLETIEAICVAMAKYRAHFR